MADTKDEALSRLASDVSEDSLYDLLNGRPYSELSYRKENSGLKANTEFVETEAELNSNQANFDAEGRHLAPNGKPSKLPYEQWVTVRTPSFKRWFGDWENAFLKNRILNDVVYKAEKGIIFGNTGSEVRTNAKNWVSTNIHEPIKTQIGEVLLTSNAINDSLSHGYSKFKLDAIPSIPSILEKGTYLGNEKDMDGRTITNHYFAGNVEFEDGPRIVFVRVREADGDTAGKRFYVHEVFTEDEIKEVSHHTASIQKDRETRGRPLYANILAGIISVNEESVSKVVDENGEPMQVYHGTPYYGFDVFDKSMLHKRDSGDFGDGFYFTPSRSYASTYALEGYWNLDGDESKVYDCFLDIRNPYMMSNRSYTPGYADLLGHDGVMVYSDTYYEFPFGHPKRLSEIVVFEPNQIKSAVDNSGEFSSENPSIYGKNVDFMRSTASTLVPYTTEQTVGRIKVGRPVDSADIRTLLATDTSMTAYQRSVLERELNAQAVLTTGNGYDTMKEGELDGGREVQEGQLYEGGALRASESGPDGERTTAVLSDRVPKGTLDERENQRRDNGLGDGRVRLRGLIKSIDEIQRNAAISPMSIMRLRGHRGIGLYAYRRRADFCKYSEQCTVSYSVVCIIVLYCQKETSWTKQRR